MKDLSTTSEQAAETPLMKQYNAIKAKYPDALLLFRVGDFYETFAEDAVKASQILGIVLTKRKNGAAAFIDLAGFPYHSLDTYLPKLVKAGLRVAICDQLEDPKLTRKIVKRDVTELVTPGVSYNDKTYEARSHNFLAALATGQRTLGIALLDVSTGQFMAAQGTVAYIEKLLRSFAPSEVLYQKHRDAEVKPLLGEGTATFRLDDWVFTPEYGRDTLLRHFGTSNLKGFGLEDCGAAIIAAGAVLHYLGETRHEQNAHIRTLSRIHEEEYVWLDPFTVRNLELVHSANEKATTLLHVLDSTCTPMGARLLRLWLLLPLRNLTAITWRQQVVTHFFERIDDLEKMTGLVKQVGDLERLAAKVASGRIGPREMVQVKRALEAIALLRNYCGAQGNSELNQLAQDLDDCTALRERIGRELQAEAPAAVNKGGAIAEGVNAELDELRQLAYHGKDYLQQLQQREAERTGISSLRVAYNNVFGYYLEVRHTHRDKVPTHWMRKQTLVNAERYITEELKEYETKILGAEEKILALESQLFGALVQEAAAHMAALQGSARAAAKLDVLMCLAKVALRNHYVRPELDESLVLHIRDGRHPVIEKCLPTGTEYVANDIYLDSEMQQIMMITGPNMSGKSAVLRQTALIVLMAQIGSFVPARSARIGLVDKIFTRVGASDNMSQGESTFMVEMNETAAILNNLTPRSLVLLDEIGRGTSTYDGISIARAIAEYLHEHPRSRARTLFATHYHELNEMEGRFTRIRNFNVSVKELGDRVIFLRKLAPGGSNHSFGIHVARMAGMPEQVVVQANYWLQQLEQAHRTSEDAEQKKPAGSEGYQLSFFQLDDPVLAQIRDELLRIDVNTLTPVEALMKLDAVKRILSGKG